MFLSLAVYYRHKYLVAFTASFSLMALRRVTAIFTYEGAPAHWINLLDTTVLPVTISCLLLVGAFFLKTEIYPTTTFYLPDDRKTGKADTVRKHLQKVKEEKERQ